MSRTLITSRDPRGLSAMQKFEAAYNKAGLTAYDAQRLNENAQFWQHIAYCISQYSAPVIRYKLARAILGDDFITPEEIAEARGITYTFEQLSNFWDIFPSEEELKWCLDHNMMLVAGPPCCMGLNQVLDIRPHYISTSCLVRETCLLPGNSLVKPVWIGLQKLPVDGSLNKSWWEQKALVLDPMVVPTTAEAVWNIITYSAVRGKYLFSDLDIRTSSLDSRGDQIVLARLLAGGMFREDFYNSRKDKRCGVISARRFGFYYA